MLALKQGAGSATNGSLVLRLSPLVSEPQIIGHTSPNKSLILSGNLKNAGKKELPQDGGISIVTDTRVVAAVLDGLSGEGTGGGVAVSKALDILTEEFSRRESSIDQTFITDLLQRVITEITGVGQTTLAMVLLERAENGWKSTIVSIGDSPIYLFTQNGDGIGVKFYAEEKRQNNLDDFLQFRGYMGSSLGSSGNCTVIFQETVLRAPAQLILATDGLSDNLETVFRTRLLPEERALLAAVKAGAAEKHVELMKMLSRHFIHDRIEVVDACGGQELARLIYNQGLGDEEIMRIALERIANGVGNLGEFYQVPGDDVHVYVRAILPKADDGLTLIRIILNR